jgi:predicted nucleic acid-binding Zn ribbon protein
MDGKSEKRDTIVCRFCGEEIPADAAACPVCGSDENTGWSDECYLDGTELPVDEDEYQEIVEKEFGGGRRATRFQWWHILAGAVVLGLTAWGLLSVLL